MLCFDFLNLFDATVLVLVLAVLIHDMLRVWPHRINCTAQRRASWRGLANQRSSPENQRRGLAFQNTTNWKSSLWNCRCPRSVLCCLKHAAMPNNLTARKVFSKKFKLWCWISWPAKQDPNISILEKAVTLVASTVLSRGVFSQNLPPKADGSQVEASLLKWLIADLLQCTW